MVSHRAYLFNVIVLYTDIIKEGGGYAENSTYFLRNEQQQTVT